jgi:hypothetical protein
MFSTILLVFLLRRPRLMCAALGAGALLTPLAALS